MAGPSAVVQPRYSPPSGALSVLPSVLGPVRGGPCHWYLKRYHLALSTILLPLSLVLYPVLYIVGALLLSFVVGFGFRKGWDFAGRWPRRRS